MLLLMFFSLLILTWLNICVTLQIGIIRNAWWNQPPTTIHNGIISCDECVCIMIRSNSTLLGLNCHLINQTCHLFANYSADSLMTISNDNHIFYFLISPFKNMSSFLTTDINQLQMNTIENILYTQIFWSFDNDTHDLYNVYNGIIINNATYYSPGITGYGSALVLQADLYQYVDISSPILDLSNSSFTFELWINANILNQSYFYGLIGKCTSNSANKCLHIALRNRQPFLDFFENNCVGQTILNTSTWYHLAFVYSYELRQQMIYLNGYLDGEKYSANPFQDSGETSLTIGMILLTERRTFDGQIDQVSFINRAKDSIEILDAATLILHYSFDWNLLDSSSMKINGTGVNISFVNQTVEFTINPSSVQATGFTFLGTSNKPYSIALWIYPYSTSGGSLLYISMGSMTSTWCLPLLGLSTSGSIIAQQYNGSNVISIYSGTIPNNTWTHIVYTYSINTGIQLYINGTLMNTSIPFSYLAMSQPITVILGLNSSTAYPSECYWQSDSIYETQYYGLMDEFYLYSRQLDINEIHKLATH